MIFLSGCEIKNQNEAELKKSDTIQNTANSKLIPVIYKGMYFKTKENRLMTECGTGKKYFISPKGEIAIMDSVYNTFNKKSTGKKIYVNVEGFTSVQQRTKEKVFDTVVVITRIIGTDTTFNCEK